MLDFDLSTDDETRLVKGSGRERLAFGVNYFEISVTIIQHLNVLLSSSDLQGRKT